MIEIIKEGHLKYIKICEHCSCEFKYEAEDVTLRTIWDDHGGHYPVTSHYEIKCPYCGKTLLLWEDNEALAKQENKMNHIDD